VASVASVFISRWDVAVAGQVPGRLSNTLGIAIGRSTYRAYAQLPAPYVLDQVQGAKRIARWYRLLPRHRSTPLCNRPAGAPLL
jgi:hypothetical protein